MPWLLLLMSTSTFAKLRNYRTQAPEDCNAALVQCNVHVEHPVGYGVLGRGEVKVYSTRLLLLRAATMTSWQQPTSSTRHSHRQLTLTTTFKDPTLCPSLRPSLHQHDFGNTSVHGNCVENGRSQDANLIASLSMINFGQNLCIGGRAGLMLQRAIR